MSTFGSATSRSKFYIHESMPSRPWVHIRQPDNEPAKAHSGRVVASLNITIVEAAPEFSDPDFTCSSPFRSEKVQDQSGQLPPSVICPSVQSSNPSSFISHQLRLTCEAPPSKLLTSSLKTVLRHPQMLWHLSTSQSSTWPATFRAIG